MQHENHDTDKSESAGDHLIGAPGEDPVERIDVGIGAADNSALVSLVEETEREALDVFENGEAHVVHGALADEHGAFDLGDAEKPTEEQIGEIYGTDDENAAHGELRVGEIGEVTIDADLDELGAEQLGDSGEEREKEIEEKGALVGADVADETREEGARHSLLGERFIEHDVVVPGHQRWICCSKISE